MIRVFTELLPDVPYVPLLYPNLGVQSRETILFLNTAFKDIRTPFVEIVENVEDADYVLLPHNYSERKLQQGYVRNLAHLAAKHSKQFLVFAHGDSDARVPFAHALVFRTSQYGYKKAKNEIMMPSYAPDLGADGVPPPREWSGARKPVIGFCGWARYKNLKNAVGTVVKDALVTLRVLCGNRSAAVRKKGLTFRRHALRVFKSSKLVTPNFLIRSSYSGHTATIKMQPEQARKEYVHNMTESDFALCVKGDGNYSYRFYEALSLGRVPVLIDTDCVLPLADTVDYGAFIIRINYRDLHRADAILRERWDAMNEEMFAAMQRKAREAFTEHLRIDRFLKSAVERLL